jgi:NAD(P)-dependent dehydrogenase (short-subunit alcohol dehydrogenase family)
MENQMENKLALVTGASQGIGRAVVKLMAAQGAEVFCCARNREKLESLKEEVKNDGGQIYIKSVDLAHPDEIVSFLEFIQEYTDHLDSVVNCAGMFEKATIEETSEAIFNRIINLNLKAPLLLSSSAIPLLRKSTSGTIVNVSSLSGCFGLPKFPGFGSYDISKYGLWGLTEIMAIELREDNIRVNQVSPSGVDTAMFRQASPPGVEPLLTPQEVAQTVLYLASDMSAPLSGENLRLFGK